MNVEVKFTYKDLLSAPDDRNRYEIFGGELILSPAPSLEHQRVIKNLVRIMIEYAEGQNFGKVLFAPRDVYFSDTTVVEPDILFVSDARRDIMDKDKVNGAPDFIAEIISESTESRDRDFKNRLYAREGVKEYWIVDPNAKSIEVYHLESGGFKQVGKFVGENRILSPYFSGMELKANQVFE